MSRLSVVIITYNEEENIKDCLESVKWAEEIIVVDSFSQDKTVEICREFTDKIYLKDFKGYALEKNFGIEKAQGEWILNIDADERVSPQLQKEIEGILKEGTPYSGFLIPRKNYFLGKWMRYGGWYPDRLLRLFKKEKGKFELREVHEKVLVEGELGFLSSPLIHNTYKNIAQYIKKQNNYSTLAARELAKTKKDFKGNIFSLSLQIILKFLETYIYKRGALDGLYGFLVSVLSSFFVFVKWTKLWEMQRKNE